MLKSDQSVLRLELEEGNQKPKPNQITYTPRCWPMTHTHNNQVYRSLCVCVWVSAGTAAKWKVSASPPAQRCATTFRRHGGGELHKLTAARASIASALYGNLCLKAADLTPEL